MNDNIINPRKGYVHIELGLPQLICHHLGIKISESFKNRYQHHQKILEEVLINHKIIDSPYAISESRKTSFIDNIEE